MTRRLGIAANTVGLACIVIALVKHETEPPGVFGALDRPDGFVLVEPNIVPWLIAATVLIVVGTGLLLRRG